MKHHGISVGDITKGRTNEYFTLSIICKRGLLEPNHEPFSGNMNSLAENMKKIREKLVWVLIASTSDRIIN